MCDLNVFEIIIVCFAEMLVRRVLEIYLLFINQKFKYVFIFCGL